MTTRRTALVAGLATVLMLAGCSSSTSGTGSTSGTSASDAGSSPSDAGSSGPTGGSTSAAASTSSSPVPSPTSASSSATETPAAVITASLEAANSAKTFQVAGTGRDSGQTVALRIHYGTNGATGSVTMSGSTISLIFIGSTVYFKAPDAFYRKQAGANAAAVLKVVGGKWVRAKSGSTTAGGFSQLGDRKALLASFDSSFDGSAADSARKVGASTVAGVPATTYADSTGNGEIDIAASGTPYLLKVVDKSATDGGTLTFTDWNEAYTASPPPASQTVTLPS